MGFLSLPEDTVPITLTDEDVTATFQIKRALSKSDINYAFMKVVEATASMPRRDDVQVSEDKPTQGVTLDVVMGMPDGQIAVLERAVMSWDLKYPKGHPDHPAPVPLEGSIAMLTSATVDALCNEIKRLNKVRGADETKDLSNGLSHTSTQTTSSLKS